METFAAREVVLVKFPFSDMSDTKLRPALVLAYCGCGDYVLCQITSRPYVGPSTVRLDDADFVRGTLSRTSFIRPCKLFTANKSIISRRIGVIAETMHRKVVHEIILSFDFV